MVNIQKRECIAWLFAFTLSLFLLNPYHAQAQEPISPVERLEELPGLRRAETIVQKITAMAPGIKPGKIKVLKRMVLEADLSEKDVENREVVETLLSQAQQEVDDLRIKLIWIGAYVLFSLVAVMHLFYSVFRWVVLEKRDQ